MARIVINAFSGLARFGPANVEIKNKPLLLEWYVQSIGESRVVIAFTD